MTSVGPYAGLESAPSPVTIHGSGFIGATKVSFGGENVATLHGQVVLRDPRYSTCLLDPDVRALAQDPGLRGRERQQRHVPGAGGGEQRRGLERDEHDPAPLRGPAQLRQHGRRWWRPPATRWCRSRRNSTTSLHRRSSPSRPARSPIWRSTALAPGPARCNAPMLASETGGLPANLVTLTGMGMNDETLNFALLGALRERELHGLPGGRNRDFAAAGRAGTAQVPQASDRGAVHAARRVLVHRGHVQPERGRLRRCASGDQGRQPPHPQARGARHCRLRGLAAQLGLRHAR